MRAPWIAFLTLALASCTAEVPTGASRAALMDDEGDPWPGGGGGGDGDPPAPGDWTPIEHHCGGADTCSWSYLLPGSYCTDATLWGPGCMATLGHWNTTYPDSPGARCIGAIYGCAAPGERTPCTMSQCEMRIYVTNSTYSCTTTPCPSDMVCEPTSGNCYPRCNPNSNDECAGGYCDPATGRCTSCQGDGDCSGDAHCESGRCVEDCDPMNPGTCAAGSCDPSTHRCVPCNDESCPEGQVCDPNNRRCRNVESCATNGGACSYGRCIDGTCQSCPRDYECGKGQVCNPDWGTCTDRCTEDTRCIGEGDTCIDGICRTPCTSDTACEQTEYCEGGYCRAAHPDASGRCPRANMVNEGYWCRAPCGARGPDVCGPLQRCDPDTGDCRIECGTETIPECNFPEINTCYMGMCLSKCDPRVTPCPSGTTCTFDDADNPVCTGGCAPSDCRCAGCPDGGTCNTATGFCEGGFDPCYGVSCPYGYHCVYGSCEPVSGGGCTWDFDCSYGEVCEYGVCVDGGHVDVCALDGACTAGETCSCEPWCCGGGGDGGGSGPGGGCGWDGGSTISYGDCHACGGHVTWADGAFYCEGMSAAFAW